VSPEKIGSADMGKTGSTDMGRVGRADIEAKLREIKGEVDTTRDRAKVPVLVIGAVTVIGVVGVAYLLGRRRGKKKTTIVEVKRV
jgi:hypothetical protein